MNWTIAGGIPVAPAALLALAVLIAGGVLWWDGRRTPAATAAARRAVRHSTVTTVSALTVLAIMMAEPVFAATWGSSAFGLPTHLVAALPAVALWGALAVLTAGELTWPRPHGSHRQARLTSRSTSDIATPATRRWTWVLVGATAVATVVLSLAASGPRTVARLEDGAVVATAGPFPGWLWTVPVLASGLVAAALSEGVLRLVALRPAVDDVAEDWDMWLRRRTARHTLRTVQCVLGLELAGLIALAGMALRWLGMGVSGNGWNTIAPQSTTFVALGNVVFWFAVAIALTVLTATLRPARDPAPRPAAGQTRGAVHS